MPTDNIIREPRPKQPVVRVPQCGHRFKAGRTPEHVNCESCWFAFFQTHGELSQAVEEVYAKHGKSLIIHLKGKKFLDMFLKFLSTIAQYKQVIEDAKASKDANKGS